MEDSGVAEPLALFERRLIFVILRNNIISGHRLVVRAHDDVAPLES